MSDPLDEILEAAGIPRDYPTRAVVDRGTHRVVTPIVEPQRIVLHYTAGQNTLDDFMQRANLPGLQQWQREYLKRLAARLHNPVTRSDPPT